jgi:glycosyltransferase involved in cell wall biosynthesis
LKVVIVSKALVRGAYQRTLEEMVRVGNLDLTVISPPSWKEGSAELTLERRFTAGYELLVTPIVFNGRYHIHFYPCLPALLNKLRPDLVHVDEEPYNLATWLALRSAARIGARRLFYTWQNLHRTLPPPFSWIERANYRTANGAIAANGDASDILRRKGFTKPIWIIPPGLDPELYTPVDRIPNAVFQLGYVGRLVPEKGIDLLLRAVARLEPPWRLTVVGEGPERAALGRLVEELALGDWVTFPGTIPSTDVPRLLRGFDVLVLPSRSLTNWREQFGRVLMEAMACGVPVVGSSCGEIPRVIGNAGIVFPEENWQALAMGLASLQKDPDRRRDLGALGRERVLRNFTHHGIAEQTLRVYRDLIDSST